MTLPLEISAPRPAHCIHWRVGTEGWIPAYGKKAGMNSDAGHLASQYWTSSVIGGGPIIEDEGNLTVQNPSGRQPFSPDLGPIQSFL